ncbi:MAG: flavin reductase family protein [Treponema sp.]|jgi:flavin reductase (DIM6/NTAB) family NADH-FMN oxidoreductase RutF|nr:flavin reductase family protein [Treponema sp.]
MKQQAAVPAGREWIEQDIRAFRGTPFERIGDQWILISAGDISAGQGNWNTMTASWGGLGVLWGKNVAQVYVRPGRHSFAFFNQSSLFSLAFFDKQYHKALEVCGTKSGRDTDKAAAAGLSPLCFGGLRSVAGSPVAGGVGFAEASELLFCRKLYTHDIDPAHFLDPQIEANYPDKDYHRLFIGEIVAYRVKQEQAARLS